MTTILRSLIGQLTVNIDEQSIQPTTPAPNTGQLKGRSVSPIADAKLLDFRSVVTQDIQKNIPCLPPEVATLSAAFLPEPATQLRQELQESWQSRKTSSSVPDSNLVVELWQASLTLSKEQLELLQNYGRMIQSIDLSNIPMNEQVLAQIAASCPYVKELNLSGCHLTFSCWKETERAALAQCRHLESIDLSQNGFCFIDWVQFCGQHI